MPVSPIGNVVVVNQMTPAVSSVANAHDNRIELQNLASQSAIQDKEKEVLEVRPTEENQELNPDREHQREEADESLFKGKKRVHDDEVDEEEVLHKLDIKV